MTLQDCIAIHEAQRPAQTVLTPLGRAHVSARRLASQLAALSPQNRRDILSQLVTTAPAGPEGRGFTLLVSHEPVTDPAA